MALVAEAKRNNLWFGTEQRMGFFPTPNRGANVSPEGWSDGGGLLNGGGYQQNSFGSARSYLFEWPGTSKRQTAQIMKSYADGSFGRGLIYFVDPLIYDTNIFPAMWADPSMGIGYEGSSLVYGLTASSFPTSSPDVNNLPVNSAVYDLTNVPPGWRGKEDAVFLPIPQGYTLHLGAMYSATGSAGVFYRTQSSAGGLGTVQQLTALSTGSTTLTNVTVTSADFGVWIWVGKSTGVSSTITLSAMTARLTSTVRPNASISEGPWIGGQGHSGCRFIGKPTYVENTGVGGGQVGFAASFREVGSWIYG